MFAEVGRRQEIQNRLAEATVSISARPAWAPHAPLNASLALDAASSGGFAEKKGSAPEAEWHHDRGGASTVHEFLRKGDVLMVTRIDRESTTGCGLRCSTYGGSRTAPRAPIRCTATRCARCASTALYTALAPNRFKDF
jgi:hypothetical protein